jgi:hypothetical protein
MENQSLNHQSMTIRRLGDADRNALLGLAQLDTARVPSGPVLGAESDGRLIAAISVESGELVADPFLQSGEAAELLRLRVGQLRPRGRRRFRRARAALPASPPGAGGRLLELSG